MALQRGLYFVKQHVSTRLQTPDCRGDILFMLVSPRRTQPRAQLYLHHIFIDLINYSVFDTFLDKELPHNMAGCQNVLISAPDCNSVASDHCFPPCDYLRMLSFIFNMIANKYLSQHSSLAHPHQSSLPLLNLLIV